MKRILVDGFNLAFRAFYAMPGLTRASDGFPLGAIHGWVRMLWRLQDAEAPASIVIFFDKEGSARHLSLHSEYKANRAETPPDLARQFPEIKRISALLGFCVIEQAGVEADDLIASAAKAFPEAGDEVLIASADKDFAQCVNDKVNLLTPVPSAQAKSGWCRLNASGVHEKFGVQPRQIVDYLALIGDSVDNIPGLKGVGPKTAVAWLEKYETIDGLLANQTTIEPLRFRSLLAESEPLLRLNQQLIAFRTDFVANWQCCCEMDIPAARAFFVEMEMNSTVKELERRTQNQLELF